MAHSSPNNTTSFNSIPKRNQKRSRKVNNAGDSPTYHNNKRTFDLVIVILSLLVLMPFMLVIGILIKLDSPGPIFYRQQRVGTKRTIRNGKVDWEVVNFNIFKFRSMYTNTNDAIHQEHVRAWINGELDNDESGAMAKVKNDPRITRVGHILRKTSLDELPQLFNILRGEMSIVGPRPVPEYEVAQYRPEDHIRLKALPGLTGLWQAVGRGNVSFEEMMKLDTEYIHKRSFLMDISIILRTIPSVLLGSGAE